MFVLVWENPRMLRARMLLERGGVAIADVACRHASGVGEVTEQTLGHTIVFVRRGCFVRRAEGVEHVLDPTVAYCMNPSEEQRYDHPHDHGDDCTAVFLEPLIVASLWPEGPRLPLTPLRTSPQNVQAHLAGQGPEGSGRVG